MNKKQQGDIGVAAAVLHYTKQGFTVSQPLTDNSRYDLIVDDGITLRRIQCKTTNFFRNEAETYEVRLATSGGNQSWNKVVKKISKLECDLIFVYCMNGTEYEFPAEVLDGKASIRLGPKQDHYKITS